MNLRFRLLLEFVAVALLALIVFGIVAYRIALDSADRKEEELLSHIAQSLAISLSDATPPAAMPGISRPSLPPVKTPDLLTFVIPSPPSKPPFAIGDTPSPENTHFPISQLINSNQESGRVKSAGKAYLWVTQTIPGTANRVLIAHPRDENPGTFFETLGARFVITGLAILWITVWGSLIISAFVAKRLNQKNDELMQANALLKAEMEERTRAEESTRLALTQKLEAETSNKAKGVFLANMSHELRTPLNSILGFSQMLGMQLTSNSHDDWAEDAKQIYASGTHLLSLINDLLDLSKIEEGKMQFHLDQFEIDPVLHDLQINVTPLVAQNNNQFEIICQTAAGSMLADITKVRQILLNLISNACKFTKDGRISLSVKRISKDGQEQIVFSLADTGIGMDQQTKDRLFKPFEQADNSTTRKYGGTGLGLAITKRYCDMVGGSIKVESEPGQGSIFTVYLPAVWAIADYEHLDQQIFFGAPAKLVNA